MERPQRLPLETCQDKVNDLLEFAERSVYWHVYDELARDSGLSGDAARFPRPEVDQESIW